MAIESNFRELFSESVTLFAPSSRDMYGKRSYASASVVVPAHLVAETELIRTLDGREVVQSGKVYLYGTPTVDTSYRIVLADGSEPSIIAVDAPYDQNGPHHTVVRIGEMNA
jgi:hypothetical protein